MKSKFFLLLLVFLTFLPVMATSEIRPMTTSEGEVGFFVPRLDMEKIVGDLEAFKLLKADYATLQGWYQEGLKKIKKLQDGALVMDIIIGAGSGVAGFFLGRASK
jgi:hypothetical protein